MSEETVMLAELRGNPYTPEPLPPIPGLDPGIFDAVTLLRNHGVYTIESCQGGEGHSYDRPTVRFKGQYGEGFRALGIAIDAGLPVRELRRVYWIQNSGVVTREVEGAWWELVFAPTK